MSVQTKNRSPIPFVFFEIVNNTHPISVLNLPKLSSHSYFNLFINDEVGDKGTTEAHPNHKR